MQLLEVDKRCSDAYIADLDGGMLARCLYFGIRAIDRDREPHARGESAVLEFLDRQTKRLHPVLICWRCLRNLPTRKRIMNSLTIDDRDMTET